MNKWILQRNEDGAFVADTQRSTNGGSYTRNVLAAKLFTSREAAERDACGNETARRLDSFFGD